MQQQIIDMLLKITPECVHHIEIITPPLDGGIKGQAICSVSKNPPTKTFFIKTPPPLKSGRNLLIFLHECAHIALGHVDADPNTLRPTHPHYNTYSNEIIAWAKVDRWLEQYGFVTEGKKAFRQSALEFAWKKLHKSTK